MKNPHIKIKMHDRWNGNWEEEVEPCRKCGEFRPDNERIGLSSVMGNNKPHAYLCKKCVKLWKVKFDKWQGHGVKDTAEWNDCWQDFIKDSKSPKPEVPDEKVVFT